MVLFRILTLLTGSLLLAGEAARWLAGGSGWPKPVDELVAGVVLVVLGLAGRAARGVWWAAGWALFTGVMLGALVANWQAALAPGGKAGAPIYLPVLAVLVVAGAAATWLAGRRA